MRQFSTALRLLALCCLCLTLTGCPQPETLPDGNATDLVRKAVETRANLKNLTGRGEMKIVDRDKDFSLSVKIEMAVQDPDRLRIRATKLADAIVAFDMLMVNKKAAFYVPTRKTLYQGDADNLKQGGVNFSPREIIARILHADRGLLDRQWKIQGKTRDSILKGTDLVLEQIHKKGEPYVIIRIDVRREVLSMVQHYNIQNELFFQEEYSGYKEIMSGKTTPSGNKIGSGIFLPSRFTLSWPNTGRLVSVTLRDYDYDQPESALADSWTLDDFDPKGVKIRSLNQVNVDSDPNAAASAAGAGAPASTGATSATRQPSARPATSEPAPASSARTATSSTGSASSASSSSTTSSGGSSTASTGTRGKLVSDPF